MPDEMGANNDPSLLTESEKRILGLLFKRRAMTQADISRATGLTQQSASRICTRLSRLGFLFEGDRVATGKRGYPSATFMLEPSASYAFGVSLQVECVFVSLVDFSGGIVEELSHNFTSMYAQPVLAWINRATQELCARHGIARSKVAGVGVGIAGSHIGESEQEGFNTPFQLEDWAGVDISERVAGAVGFPVWTDNDGNVAALGECMIGVGRWANSFAYLNLGFGVGGGVILDGELWRGRYGNAGEFAGGLPPNIYPFPNLELLRRILVSDGIELNSVNELVEKYDPSWSGINDWIARVRDSLSIIASNATAILDVDVIVLGGRMPRKLAERVIGHIELYDQMRRSVPRPTARLVPAEAAGNAAALGAAVLPLQNTYFT